MQDQTADLELAAIADALDAHGIAHENRGGRIRTDCPNCGKTGRRGRRDVVISEKPRGLVTYASCGCRIVDIATALDLPRASLLSYARERVRSTRDATGETRERGLPADAKPRGVTLAVNRLKRGTPGRRNLGAIAKVAEDLDRLGIGERDWKAYDTRRAATDLGIDRTSVRRALRWLVDRGILKVEPTPAPNEKIVTASGRETFRSGVKRFRLLSEREQIERLSRRRG